ncbi:MAG TPA: 3-isopropylmalate dehydratase small subunit, partial [Clostridiales bacterium]|nr:3-isopropylmalate dehydratase small subunit [Clostridiales bacterium]
YGNNIDTDVIIPARYLNTSDPKELAAHCMEDLDKTFASRVKPGDILMAGTNFGCGSSREHAPMAIKASGIACVVAIDFARIFYRNAINIGLPILECADAVKECREGDQLDIDFNKGTIYNVTQGKTYQTFPFPPFLQNIIQAGGLMQAAKKTKPEGRV